MFSFRFRFRYRFYMPNLIINYINNALEWGMCNSPSPSTSTAPSSSLCSTLPLLLLVVAVVVVFFFIFCFCRCCFFSYSYILCLSACNTRCCSSFCCCSSFRCCCSCCLAFGFGIIFGLLLNVFQAAAYALYGCVCVCACTSMCVCVCVHRAIRLATFVLVQARWPAVHTLKGLWRRCCCCCVGCGCALDSSCTHDENKKSRFFFTYHHQ